MIKQEAIAAFEEGKKKIKKPRRVGLMRKMDQGETWETFISSSIFGPVGGQNSLNKRF